MAMLALVLLVTACVHPYKGEQHAQRKARQDALPVSPTAAFHKVGQPRSVVPPLGGRSNGLSGDIQRLQNAHQQYRHDQAQQRVHVKDRQQACHKAGGQRIPIQDGSDKPATYCHDARVKK